MKRRKGASLLLALSLLSSACLDTKADADYLTVVNGMSTPSNLSVYAVIAFATSGVLLSNTNISTLRSDGSVYGRVNVNGQSGTMRVTIVASTTPDDTIAVGKYTFTLTPGNVYSVNIRRQVAGTGSTCIGCDAALGVPFTGSARATTDSMWLYIIDRKPCPGCVY